MNKEHDETTDHRRLLVLLLAIGLLVTSGLLAWGLGPEGTSEFFTAATGRIGLVFAALWLAWPSLRRPARWLPPGVAVAGVVALAILAARPRLIVVAIPALGTLLVLAAVIRLLKR